MSPGGWWHRRPVYQEEDGGAVRAGRARAGREGVPTGRAPGMALPDVGRVPWGPPRRLLGPPSPARAAPSSAAACPDTSHSLGPSPPPRGCWGQEPSQAQPGAHPRHLWACWGPQSRVPTTMGWHRPAAPGKGGKRARNQPWALHGTHGCHNAWASGTSLPCAGATVVMATPQAARWPFAQPMFPRWPPPRAHGTLAPAGLLPCPPGSDAGACRAATLTPRGTARPSPSRWCRGSRSQPLRQNFWSK